MTTDFASSFKTRGKHQNKDADSLSQRQTDLDLVKNIAALFLGTGSAPHQFGSGVRRNIRRSQNYGEIYSPE